MKIDVILTAGQVETDRVQHKTVCVVDVFRATSVMINALRNGARQIIPVTTVEEAFALRKKYGGREKVLLGGERKAVLIEGFDKDNSPLAYTREDMEGATIIMTTTNGTRAIANAHAASDLYIGALINLGAVCDKMAGRERDIVIVCSGRGDRYTLEDALCAGMMTDRILARTNAETTDLAWSLRELYLRYKEDFRRALVHSEHYNVIMGMGLGADVEFCLQTDITNAVPYVNAQRAVVL